MRMTRGFVLGALIGLLGCSIASAQEGTPTTGMMGKFAVAPILGASMPIQYMGADLVDGGGGAKLGFAAGASGEYYVTDDIAVGVKFIFDRFGMNTDDIPGDASGNWTIMEFGVFGRYVFMQDVMTHPYARAGVLMGKAKVTTEAGSNKLESDVAIAPGGEIAGGVMHHLSDNLSVFGEANWTGVLTDGKEIEREFNGTTQPSIEAQKHIQWVGIKVGVLYTLGM
jgi:hypothetical protein